MPGGWVALLGLKITEFNRLSVVRTLPGLHCPSPHWFNLVFIDGYILWTYVPFVLVVSYKQKVVSTIILMRKKYKGS